MSGIYHRNDLFACAGPFFQMSRKGDYFAEFGMDARSLLHDKRNKPSGRDGITMEFR